MKKAVILTSVINPLANFPLTYNPRRSAFLADDRLYHTMITLASLNQLLDSNTTIYILELSANCLDYKDQLDKPNVKFINVKEQFAEIYDEITTHANKSRCETLLMSKFLKKYQDELADYDVLIKSSGRYFTDRSFDASVFTSDKLFFKSPLIFEWQNSWGYQYVDRRVAQGDNKLRQYSSVFFAWGKKYYQEYLNMFIEMSDILKQPDMQHYDIETLLYFLTRKFDTDIVENNWTVYGWDGAGGHFVKY
jgi:hypothetical protein